MIKIEMMGSFFILHKKFVKAVVAHIYKSPKLTSKIAHKSLKKLNVPLFFDFTGIRPSPTVRTLPSDYLPNGTLVR